jgi:hypothetical protein
VSGYGVVDVALPRVVCQCGGSVQIPFSILKPRQRFWDDVLAHIGRWASLGLSLRQMQNEIGQQIGTQVGLRKLNEGVHALKTPPPLTLTSVAPVILLDAIWLDLLTPTGLTRPDTLGRQRAVKAEGDVCVLVALGLYPQSGRWGILGWVLAQSESQADWETLLLPLEQRGVYRQRGVELFIHDGGAGLIAALDYVYPNIPHQRCLFHKLRNLYHSIQPPQGLSRPARSQFKRDLLQSVRPLFDADNAAVARDLRDAICLHYQTTQPDFVATLRRDWQQTIAFFRVLKHFPDWPRRYLRTTSLLERVNRMIRRLFRAAGAYHSVAGVLAAVARVLTPLRLI